MAPEIPNQKRKRGRPPNASKAGEDASGRAEETTTRRPKPTEEAQAGDAGGVSNAGPKKRGRPKKTPHTEPQEEEPAPAVVEKQSKRGPKAREETVAEGPLNPKKRGRPPKDRTEHVSTNAPAEETRPRKRRRPTPAAEEPVEDEVQPDPEPTKRPRGRPSKDTGKATAKGLPGRKEVASIEEEPAQEEDVRRSTRSTNPSQHSSKPTQRGKENRRDPSAHLDNGRSSLAEVSAFQAQNRMSPPQNKQTTKSRNGKKVAEAEDADVEEAAPTRQRRRGQTVPEVEDSERPEAARKNKRGPAHRPPNATIREKAVPAAAAKQQRAEKRSAKDSDTNTPGPTEKPRRRKNVGPDENEGPPAQQQPKEPKEKPPPVPKYRHLTSRTRQIPRSTIASKWSPLDPPSIAAVDSIIADAHRPILFSLRETRSDSSRYAHAQDILTTFASRLHKKLEKGMPFPPPSIPSVSKQPRDINGEPAGASHEAEFDFEKTVNAIQALERTLDPLLHSVALLKREKEKEEQELERAYRRLRTLETNARTQSRGWRERGKRDHVLAPGIRPTGPGAARDWEEEGEIELVKPTDKDTSGSVFKEIEGDEELVKVAQQLGSHMESMRGNLEQIEGVVPAMEKTKGALQGVLQKYLDDKQYDQVVFG
ncbi:CENP-Q, a CENPA-CAD centromere complex subunit-domain-containing protein [Neurospora hispaniola]|uniref:CENP-Q, a CENPA-CAD centromere complex subunit-domain-containing protein n=1 Tax=Neurospora hispaniola TaxID=588809 RepID=A0AAJ0MQD7_9PEZI|nr:CENP-Q, a CENPA-CAD centromere complex subunit-domain-containing protein [Neurospora hispaniola]